MIDSDATNLSINEIKQFLMQAENNPKGLSERFSSGSSSYVHVQEEQSTSDLNNVNEWEHPGIKESIDRADMIQSSTEVHRLEKQKVSKLGEKLMFKTMANCKRNN